MTSPDKQPGTPDPSPEPTYADRVYRSSMGIAGGVVLLAIGLWMGGDAILRGEGRTPWAAAALLVLAVPLVVAFTFRPAVYANADRLRVRNPFRTIELPWGAVATVRATYSTEAVTRDGTKYQLWAVPVSLRERKKAVRAKGAEPGGAQRTLGELRDLAERGEHRPSAQGEPRVRWAYEILAPAAVGLVAVVVLVVTG